MGKISAELQAKIDADWENGTSTDLTPEQAAELTGYSVKTIRNAYQAGSLRAFQPVPGGRVHIPVGALYEWLSRPAARATEPALEDVDWATPAAGADPTQDFTLCDRQTLYLTVHASRLSEFAGAKIRAGR